MIWVYSCDYLAKQYTLIIFFSIAMQRASFIRGITMFLHILVSFSSNLISEEHHSYRIEDKLNNKHEVIYNK
jgi:hypothetical protein